MPDEPISAFARIRRGQDIQSLLSTTQTRDAAPILKSQSSNPLNGIQEYSAGQNGDTGSNSSEDLSLDSPDNTAGSHAPPLSVQEVCVKLDQDESIAIGGVYDLAVIKGSVRIYGAVLNESPRAYRIYAPLTHAIPSINALASSAEVLIQSLSIHFDLPPPISITGVWDYPRRRKGGGISSMTLLGTGGRSYSGKSWSALDTSSWNFTLQRLVHAKSHPVRVLVCGNRRTGKSTFAAHFINYYLTTAHELSDSLCARRSVYLLDLDATQPLLRPPGSVYVARVNGIITGPPFTQPCPVAKNNKAEILRELHINKDQIVNQARTITTIIENLATLVGHSCQDSALVINASTWAMGIIESMPNTMSKLGVTDVVELDRQAFSSSREAISRDESGITTHRLGAVTSHPAVPSSSLRALQTQAHFQIISYDLDGGAIWSSLPLSNNPDIVQKVSFAGPDAAIQAITTFSGTQIHPSHLAYALRGAVVTVMAVKSTHLCFLLQAQKGGSGFTIVRTPEGLPLLVSDDSIESPFLVEHTQCRGLAYISGLAGDVLYAYPASGTVLARDKEFDLVLVLGENDGRWVDQETREYGN